MMMKIKNALRACFISFLLYAETGFSLHTYPTFDAKIADREGIPCFTVGDKETDCPKLHTISVAEISFLPK